MFVPVSGLLSEIENEKHVCLFLFSYRIQLAKYIEFCCSLYVMRSSKISLNSMYAPYLELYFVENPVKIGLTVPEI